jgi:HlyD family secretion protein
MKVFLRVLLVVILIGVFGYTLYFLYNKSKEKDVLYQTELPAYRTIIKKTVATGAVIPRKEIDIKPRVSGIVDELYVEPGEIVKRGDRIAKVKIIPNMVSLNSAESRVDKAKIQYKNAKIDYDRNKKLYKDGVIALAEFQQYELVYENAKEELETAEDNLELIKEGVTKRSGSATNTIILATIDGMVLDVPVEVGNSVIESNTFNEGTTIASVADMGEMIFEGKIDESEVGKIKEGMDLILTIGALENEVFNAELEYISPKGVEENGAIQFEIKAAINLKVDVFIRAGYSANADIVLDKKDSVLSIPESLITFERGKKYLEIETGEQEFEKREVETGLSDGIFIEIVNGLNQDEKIKNPNKTIEK